LGTFQYIWDKSAIKDVGRVLGVPFSVTNEITKQLGDLSIEYALSTGMFDEYQKKYPKLFEYAQKLAGLPRSFGTHACGRVVTIKEVDYYTAVAVNDGNIVIQGDMGDAEDLGLVKIDILGLKSLDVIYDTLDMIGKDYDYIDTSKMNYKDEKVLKLFREGHTEGVFQFELV
jgi:DNA polymerase III subunit alpha